MTLEQFNAAARAHTPGQRRSKDLLSSIARCGLCGRVAGIEYNQRNQPLYRCKHRGKGCAQPARSANGLHRAAVLGLRLLATDADLQAAIRHELTSHHNDPTATPPPTAAITRLNGKLRKLLDLYYAEKITAETFAAEEHRLTTQIDALKAQAHAIETATQTRSDLADRFDHLAQLLATLDIDTLWDEATDSERRTLVNDLVDSVNFYPDQITVQVAGAPPILVTLAKVGLRAGARPRSPKPSRGTKPVVSEGVSEFRTSFTGVAGHRSHLYVGGERWECPSWLWQRFSSRAGPRAR